MKRARRQTVRRGNMSGRQRRRMLALLREAHKYGCTFAHRRYSPARFRDARRLHESGLAVAVCSRPDWSRPGQPREVCVFPTLADALRRYPRGAIMRGER